MPKRHHLSSLDGRVLRRIPRLVAPGLLTLIAVVLAIHVRDRDRDFELGAHRAKSSVRILASQLEAELETVVSTARFLDQDPAVRGFLSDLIAQPEAEERFVDFCSTLERFDQVRLLNLAGDELIRVERHAGGASVRAVPKAELQSKAERYYFQRARRLDAGEFYISRFDLNEENGRVQVPWKPVVRLATPALDGSGQVRGILVVNYLGGELLERLRKSESPSHLVDREGFFLLGPDNERSFGFQFGKKPTFAHDHPAAWEALADQTKHLYRGDPGLFVQESVRGLPVGVEGESDLGLRVIAHLPTHLLFASSYRALRGLVVISGCVAGLLLLAAWRLAYAAELRSMHERALQISRSNLRDLSAQLLEAQEQERLRISRDLHDEVGQIATAVSIQLQRARRLDDGETKDELIDASLEGTGELLDAMHRISSSLRSSVLDDMGLESALRAHLEPLAAKSGMEIQLDLRASDREVPNPVGVHAFRIVQEAMTNVLRHAAAQTVRIETWVTDAVLHIVVSDDGAGIDLDGAGEKDRQRLGIVGMRERTELFGGGLEVHSAKMEVHSAKIEARSAKIEARSGKTEPPHPDRGTTLHAWIPLARVDSPNGALPSNTDPAATDLEENPGMEARSA